MTPPKKTTTPLPRNSKCVCSEGGGLSFWPNTGVEGGAIRGRKDAAAPATAAAAKKENPKLPVCHFHFCKARLFKNPRLRARLRKSPNVPKSRIFNLISVKKLSKLSNFFSSFLAILLRALHGLLGGATQDPARFKKRRQIDFIVYPLGK